MIYHITELLKKKACRGLTCLIIATAILAPTCARAGLSDMPSEITLANAPVSLDMAVKDALENNRSIKSAALNKETADRKVRETDRYFGFRLNANGMYQRYEDDAMMGPVQLFPDWQHTGALTLKKPVYGFGKKPAAVAASRKAREIAILDVALSRLNISSEVKVAFHSVLLAEQAVKVQEESLSRAEAHHDDTKKRHESGIGVKLDVIRAQTDVKQANESLTNSRKNYAIALKSLNNTIGYPYGRELKITDRNAFSKVELNSLGAYIETALDKRPELKQIALGMEAVKLSIRLDKNFPILAFSSTYNFHSRGVQFSSQDSWSVMFVVDVPIWDQGHAEAKTAQKKLRIQDMKLTENDLLNGIQLQVEKSYLDMKESGDRLETSKSILEMAGEAYRISELSYGAGFATQIDVLDAAHGLTQAKLNHAKSQYDYEIAKTMLALACGIYSLEER